MPDQHPAEPFPLPPPKLADEHGEIPYGPMMRAPAPEQPYAHVRNSDLLCLVVLTCEECGLVKPALAADWELRSGIVYCSPCARAES